MTQREKQILELISANPLISQKDLALKLGIQRSSVAVHITNLIRKGYIRGRGYLINEPEYVVVIGGANIDITGFVERPLIGSDSNPGKIRMSAGGVGRNIAENLVLLGIKTRLISVVGDDAFGKRIVDDCLASGIDMSLVKTVPAKNSSVYLSILNPSGDMELAVSDMEIAEQLDVTTLKQHHSTISNASAIVVDTNLPEQALAYLATTYPGKLFLDTVSTAKTLKVKGFIGSFKVIKPNRIEAETLLNRKIKSLGDAEKAIGQFLAMGIETAVISMGNQGVVFGNGEGVDTFRLKGSSSVNVTGAGDAFMAVLVLGFLQQIRLEETIRMASTAACLTLESENTLNPEMSLEAIRNKRKELNI